MKIYGADRSARVAFPDNDWGYIEIDSMSRNSICRQYKHARNHGLSMYAARAMIYTPLFAAYVASINNNFNFKQKKVPTNV